LSKGSVQGKREGAFSIFSRLRARTLVTGTTSGADLQQVRIRSMGVYLEIEEYPCWDLQRPSNQAEQDHCLGPEDHLSRH
jgi:hypothetical protein